MSARAGHPPFKVEQAQTEPTPLEPLYEVADLVARAQRHLLDAAKIADASDMPAVHMELTDTRDRVQRCQAELTTWTTRGDGS